MAEEQENGLIEADNHHALGPTAVVVSSSDMVAGEGVNEDLLQQALVASEEYDQEPVAYTVQTDADEIPVVNTVGDSNLVTAQLVANENGTAYRVVNTLPDGTISIPDDLTAQSVVQQVSGDQLGEGEVALVDPDDQQIVGNEQIQLPVSENGEQTVDAQQIIEQMENGQIMDQMPIQIQETESQPVQQLQYTVAVQQSNQGSGAAPLGSSSNPIRIIQQGNQYTPVQQLTTDQLQQIMQVCRFMSCFNFKLHFR